MNLPQSVIVVFLNVTSRGLTKVDRVVGDLNRLNQDSIHRKIVGRNPLVSHCGTANHWDRGISSRRQLSGLRPSRWCLLVDLGIQVEGGSEIRGSLLDEVVSVGCLMFDEVSSVIRYKSCPALPSLKRPPIKGLGCLQCLLGIRNFPIAEAICLERMLDLLPYM